MYFFTKIIELFPIILVFSYICDVDLQQSIRSYSAQPLTHQLLLSLLRGYRRPNDKIHALLREEILAPVKKGLYIAGPAVNTAKPEPFLLANHILGPSYVSSDTALSYHGLIPERVYEIISMTTKTPRKYSTSMGLFSYTRLPLPYYSFGIRQIKLSDEQFALVASPEKALFDKVVTTPGVLFRSPRTVMDYLVDNLRIDEDNLKNLDTKIMLEWVPKSLKKESLLTLINTIQSL